MAIAGYCPKRKAAINKAKAEKIARRQAQAETTQKTNISVIVPKPTGRWEKLTDQGSTGQRATGQEITGQGSTGQKPNIVNESDPLLEPETPRNPNISGII